MQKDSTCLLYDSFADLLTYPTSSIWQQAETCLIQLRESHPEAALALEMLSLNLQQHTLEQMEELYTVVFDMQPVCYPYVGYQLFGESYKRGAFMAQLNEAYHAFGYSAGRELPDHLSVILRFLGLDSANRQGEFCEALLNEGVVPALDKMLRAFEPQSENPYFGLLTALRSVLTYAPEKEFDHA
ncbi:hypothetical protein ANAEL_00871 [Anaerolineales bacterium]|nr:hypothetical protein ANAEL_00871 [Anaerolineales bacterium]